MTVSRTATALYLVMFSATPAWAQKVDELLGKNNCLMCHSVDKKVVGPSYEDVAAKYRGQADAEKTLAGKIRSGGAGVWGQMPMPANPGISDADAAALAKWVLSR